MATSTPWVPVARLIRSPASSAVGSTVKSAPSAKARARRPSIGSTAITVVAPLRAAIWTVIRPMAPMPNTATASPIRTLPSRTATIATWAGSEHTASVSESPPSSRQESAGS